MSNNFNDLFFAFTEHLRVKNYSPATIAAYTEHLPGFFGYLAENKITDIKRVTRDILKAYQLKLTESGGKRCGSYTVATISIKIRSVKRFFEYLESSNYSNGNK